MKGGATTVKPQIAYGALLGRVICHYRERLGIHQHQIATALGISQSAYSRLEKGQSAMSVTQLRVIASQLGIPPARVLDDVDRYAQALRHQGALITDDKQQSSSAGLLVALGLLTAVLASRGSG